ncbi:MAG: transglycosylase SLT domain-containing protein [Pseudomonadota bacterium]|nr:transglycosylase SLT domain-containing protein [Pseudomonadota bacterium]
MARARRGWGVFAAAAFTMLWMAAAPAVAISATPRIKPPPPGPEFAAPSDLVRLENVQDAISKRDWTRARALARDLSDPVAQSLAQWMYFYAEDPLVSIPDVDAFLDAHPDWPASTKIQLHAEKRMASNLSPEIVLAFFDTRDPISGEGSLALARAQFATGAREAAELRLREAWVNQNFTVGDEQRLLSQYGRLFTPEDHAARVDRLLWSREVTAARRVFSRLTSSERRKAEARAALLLGAASGPELYRGLDDEDRADPGVMLAAVRYYRRTDSEPIAVMIARQASGDPALLRNPSRWWEERQLLMRWALTEGQYADAYAMAAGHGLEPGGNDFAEAEFDAGWIALRFLNAPERAETHFSALAASVSAPISLSRAFYWLARAAEARGEADIAKARYGQAAEFIYTYYGQLAAEKLGGAAAARGFAPPITPTPEEVARFEARPTVAALRILSDLKADQPFLIFAYQVDDQLDSAGEYVELMRLAERLGATHVTVRAGKVGIGRGAFAPEVAYPLIAVPAEAARFVSPEFILGLARQESEFNPRAFSHAGARGLMQLIPSTAQLTARKEKLRYDRNALLNDPFYNMIIGSAHLSHLMERFNGSLVMTFAAYNAGVNRVDQWVGRYGDPRSPEVDPIDWVEQIPFSETRNYVQRVLENAQVYRSRLSDSAIAGRLAADIEIGGPRGRAGALAAIGDGGASLPPISDRILRIAATGPHLPPPETAVADTAPAANDGVLAQPPARGQKRPGRDTPAKEKPAPKPASKTKTVPAAGAKPIAGDAAVDSGETPAAILNAEILAERAADEAEAEGAPAGDSVPMLGALVEPEVTAEECKSYRDYIAETDKQEASADDLNAGMRAELASGGPSC